MAAAEKAFIKWKADRELKLKEERTRAKEHKVINEKMEEEKKNMKKADAEKVSEKSALCQYPVQIFQVWVKERTARTRSLSARKKRREDAAEKKKLEEKKEKQAIAEKCFAEWKRHKAPMIVNLAESFVKEHEHKEEKKTAREAKKRDEADAAYRAWLERKEQQRLEQSYSSTMNLFDEHTASPPPWLPPGGRAAALPARKGTRTRRRASNY